MRTAASRATGILAAALSASATLAAAPWAREIEVQVTAPAAQLVTLRALPPFPRTARTLSSWNQDPGTVFAEAQVVGAGVARLGLQAPLRVRLTASGPGLVPQEVTAVAEDPPDALKVQAPTPLDLGPLAALAEETKVFVRVRPSSTPADCRPQWRSEERDLVTTREELSRLPALPDDLVSAFVPELGELSLRPAERARTAEPPTRRLVHFRRRLAASREPVVLTFGRSEIAIARFDSRDEAVVAAPPGEWRLRALSYRGSGTWSGLVVGASEETIEIVEQEPVEVRVEAVDSRGLRAPEAAIWKFADASDAGRWRGPSAPVMHLLPDRGEALLACASAPGFFTASRVLRAGDASTVVKITLTERPRPPGSERWVTGRLVDADGVAVAGAQVLAVRTGHEEVLVLTGRSSQVVEAKGAPSDANGEFRLGPLRSPGEVALLAAVEGRGPVSLRRVALAVDGLVDVDLGVVEVPAAREVAGRVTEQGSGDPIAGARLRVAVLESEHSWTGLRREPVLSDERGVFKLQELPPGSRLRIFAEADGLVAGRVDLEAEASPDDQRLNLTLSRGATVRGRVIASDGVAIAGAELFAQATLSADFRRNPLASLVVRAKSRSDGSFELLGLPCAAAPAFALTAHAEGFVRRRVELPPLVCGAEGLTSDVVLARSILWTGRVLQRRDGQPVPGAVVAIEGRGPRTKPDGSFRWEVEEAGTYAGHVVLPDGLEVPFVVSVTDAAGLIQDLWVP